MRKLLSIALCLPLAACVIGQDDPGTGGGDDQGDDGTNNPPADGSLTGLITDDATWSGSVLIGLDRTTTQIEPGVTITVSPGTEIKFKPGAGLVIKGTLRVQGTSADKIKIGPSADNTYGLTVHGALELGYAEMTRGNIQTNPGSTVKIADTLLTHASGDLLIMSGGTVDMSYSQIGVPDDSTHCLIHTSGNANTIKITRSNIIGADYGLMLYGGQNADFTNNNWLTNGIDIATQPGVSGDVSGGYFDRAAPVAGPGATLTTANLSAARLTDAGIRP